MYERTTSTGTAGSPSTPTYDAALPHAAVPVDRILGDSLTRLVSCSPILDSMAQSHSPWMIMIVRAANVDRDACRVYVWPGPWDGTWGPGGRQRGHGAMIRPAGLRMTLNWTQIGSDDWPGLIVGFVSVPRGGTQPTLAARKMLSACSCACGSGHADSRACGARWAIAYDCG